MDRFQECDQVSVFKAITKETAKVTHRSRVSDCLRTVFRIDYSERGPVLFDIPRDYFYGEVEDQILKQHLYRVDTHGCGSTESLDKVAELLANANILLPFQAGEPLIQMALRK
ncbi:hypothetical protein ACFWDG_24045 [Peribacillus sp. NPDC060186]